MTNFYQTDKQIISRFHQFQDEKGYVSDDDLHELAIQTQRPLAELHGLLSFFDSVRTSPPGKNIVAVCYGTPCFAHGAETIYNRLTSGYELDEEGTSTDRFITLEKVQCVGACSLAPVISVNGKLEGNIKPQHMAARLEALKD